MTTAAKIESNSIGYLINGIIQVIQQQKWFYKCFENKRLLFIFYKLGAV